MTPREAAWRAASAVSLRVRPLGSEPIAPPTWRGAWPERLRGLARTRPEQLAADATRIAAGELDLWGRTLEIDPHRVAWDQHPVGPSADRKPGLELNRHQHLFPLAAGAALAGREDWARLCCEQLLDWIEQHPPATWESGYETAHRLVGWAWTVPLLGDALTDAELSRVSASYVGQVAFTAARPSRFSSANNHRLAELTGLIAAVAVGVDLDWKQVWAELEEQVGLQTYADGGSREQSGGYFLYVLEMLWVAGTFARATGRSLGALEERLRAMLRWLELVADSEGEPPPLGDDAEDRMLRVEYFEPRRARAIAGRVRALLEGDLTLAPGKLGTATESIVLPESGLAVFRGGSTRVVVDVGELGFGSLAAHGHPDALSLLLDHDAEPILRDSGTCAYSPPALRERHRATAAHNTVVVDGRNQAQALGPHLWGHRFETRLEAHALTPELDYVRASHDGYRPAIHARSVSFLKPDLILVLDRVTGPREIRATLGWQFARGVAAKRLTVAAAPPATHADADGPFSPRYTWCMEAPRSTWSARGREVVFVTVIAVYGDAPTATADHELGETLVQVAGRRLLERWGGGPAEVTG
jgi:hypothetical protein